METGLALFAGVVAYRCFTPPLRRANSAASWGWIMAATTAGSLTTAVGSVIGWRSPITEIGWVLSGVVIPSLLVARTTRNLTGSEFPRLRLRTVGVSGITAAAALLLTTGDVRVDVHGVIPRIATDSLSGLAVTVYALGAWIYFLVGLATMWWQSRGLPELQGPHGRVRNVLLSTLVGTAFFVLAPILEDRGAADLARVASMAAGVATVLALGISTSLGTRWEIQHRPPAS